VNYIFNEKYNINSILRIYFDEYKRPYQLHKQKVDFNISHSGKWVTCAISERNKVGIDVQEINERASTYVGIRFYSDKEANTLLSLNDHEKRLYFFHIWTLKESYIKAKSETFAIPLNSFYFDVTHQESPRFYTEMLEEQNKWLFKSFCIDNNNYWLSVCSYKEDTVEKSIFINIDTLINSFL
jgi:4'-phosphopantetheinyl transferase